MIYRRLEDIDWSKYEVDPIKGVYSHFWGDWLTGNITTEKKTGLKRRHLGLTDKKGKSHSYFYDFLRENPLFQ